MANRTAPRAFVRNAFFVAALGVLAFTLAAFGAKAVLHPERLARYAVPGVGLHAVVMVAWLALVAAQAFLIGTGRPHAHRITGMLSVALAVMVVWTGWQVVVGVTAEFERYEILIFNTGTLIGFVFLYGAALALARAGRIESHKRLMLLATIVVTVPAFERATEVLSLPRITGLLGYLLAIVAVPLLIDARTRGRPHPASLFGIAVVFAQVALSIAALGAPPVRAWAVAVTAGRSAP